MARLKSLPSLEIIQGYKGVIDYFVTRGIPCARRWPRYSKDRMSAPALAAAQTFGLIVQAWALLPGNVKDELSFEASDQPRSARDIMVSGVLGHLHENAMTDLINLLTSIDSHLADLEGLLNALASIAADEVRGDVISSVLPSGAATQATLATLALETGGNLSAVKTALQIIDDFALPTNKLFGYFDRYAENIDWTMAAAAETKYTTPVPAGEIWLLNSLSIRNRTGAATTYDIYFYIGATQYVICTRGADTPQWVPIYWNGSVVLKEGDRVGFEVTGGAANEVIEARVWGYKMKVA